MENLNIYRFIKEISENSKKFPKRYASSPKCLDEQWGLLDLISLYILDKDVILYGMGAFRVEKGMQGMDFTTHIKDKEQIEDEDEIFKRIIEWRNQYEKWLKEKLLKEAPSLKEIL